MTFMQRLLARIGGCGLRGWIAVNDFIESGPAYRDDVDAWL